MSYFDLNFWSYGHLKVQNRSNSNIFVLTSAFFSRFFGGKAHTTRKSFKFSLQKWYVVLCFDIPFLRYLNLKIEENCWVSKIYYFFNSFKFKYLKNGMSKHSKPYHFWKENLKLFLVMWAVSSKNLLKSADVSTNMLEFDRFSTFKWP